MRRRPQACARALPARASDERALDRSGLKKPRLTSAADLMLLGTVTLWAFNFTVSKYILDHGLRPLAYSSTRYACAAAIFVAITLIRERSLRIGRGQLPLIAVCTVLLFA